MKRYRNLCLILLSAVLSLPAMAQDVPASVTSAFNEKYPNAQDVEWEQEAKGFEAEFQMNGRETEATFNADGKWIETMVEIGTDEVPAAVIKSIEEKFNGYEIKDADEFESSVLGVDLYEMELEKGDSEVDLVLNKDGKILAQETDDDDLLDLDFDKDEVEIESK